jgi:hypothetical protein
VEVLAVGQLVRLAGYAYTAVVAQAPGNQSALTEVDIEVEQTKPVAGEAQGAKVNTIGGVDLDPIGKVKFFLNDTAPGLHGVYVTQKEGQSLDDMRKEINDKLKKNVDHFNWYQVVNFSSAIFNNNNLPIFDAKGNRLKLGTNFVDPPPGGYGDGKKLIQWGDDLPWYYDEKMPAQDIKKTPAYKEADQVSQNVFNAKDEVAKDLTSADKLRFFDRPQFPIGLTATFKTWLVGVEKDGKNPFFLRGFSWTVTAVKGPKEGETALETKAVGNLPQTPSDAEYKDIIGGFSK